MSAARPLRCGCVSLSSVLTALGANQHLRRAIIDENHVCPGVGGMREMHKAAAGHSIFMAGSLEDIRRGRSEASWEDPNRLCIHFVGFHSLAKRCASAI